MLNSLHHDQLYHSFIGGHSISTYAPKWHKFVPHYPLYVDVRLLKPRFHTHLTPTPISNWNVFKYPIINSIKEKTVKHLREVFEFQCLSSNVYIKESEKLHVTTPEIMNNYSK